MAYPYDDEDDILLRLQQILEPEEVRRSRQEGEPVPITPDAIDARDRESRINQAWKQELFPERRADDWRSRTSKVLGAIGDRLRQGPEEGNEWLGAVSAGAKAYREAGEQQDAFEREDAKSKLAALATSAQVESRADKNALSYENMLLKYGNLDRRADIAEQSLQLRREDSRRRSDERRQRYAIEIDNLKIRMTQLGLNTDAGKRAAKDLYLKSVRAKIFELGLDNPIEKIGSPEEEATRRRDLEGAIKELRDDPMFSFLFTDEAATVPRGTGGHQNSLVTPSPGRPGPKKFDLTKKIYTSPDGKQRMGFNTLTGRYELM